MMTKKASTGNPRLVFITVPPQVLELPIGHFKNLGLDTFPSGYLILCYPSASI